MPDGQPTRRQAIRIIESLAQSGQPPKLGARFLNVGTESLLRTIRLEYLDDLLQAMDGEDGLGACRWIEAQYGNGKTQFLRCIQEEAWHHGYVTAFVELSQDECPLDRPERVYRAIASSVQAQPLTPADVDRGRGLDVTLQQLVDRKFDGVLTGMPDASTRDQAAFWIENSLADTPVESSGFREAVVALLMGKLNGDVEAAKLASQYLRGEPLPAAELKKIGVYEKLDKASGFRFIRSMCQLLQRSDLATGTVLLFDEARRSLSLMSTKQQKVACENLLNIINRCNSGELPGTLFLYAVMPEFFTDFVAQYPALQQRCGPATRIDLESIRGLTEADLLRQMGRKITSVFKVAHGTPFDDKDKLEANLTIFARTALEEAMITGQRRAFVMAWVRALNYFRDQGLTMIDDHVVADIMSGVQSQIDAAECAIAEGE